MEAIGLLTGVKWSKLSINGKIKAIWERLLGGGRNPYGTLFAHVRHYMVKTKSEEEIYLEINALKDGWRKDALKAGFDNFLTLFRGVHGKPITLSKRMFPGHIGRFKLWAMPQVCVQVGNEVLFLLLWNNKKPELDLEAAEMGCLVMRDSYADQPNARFFCIDLRLGVAYELRSATADMRRTQTVSFCEQIERFVVRIEDEIKRRKQGEDRPGSEAPPPPPRAEYYRASSMNCSGSSP